MSLANSFELVDGSDTCVGSDVYRGYQVVICDILLFEWLRLTSDKNGIDQLQRVCAWDIIIQDLKIYLEDWMSLNLP